MKTSLFLAATTDLNVALGKVVGLLQAFSMVITFGAIVVAAVSIISGRLEFLKHSILGAAVAGLGWVLVTTLFNLGGFEGAIDPQSF